MKVAFLASDKTREQLLADAILQGARRHGHETEVLALQPEPVVGDYHVACMVGVKSRELFQAHRRAGIPVIYLDKGYSRHKRPGLAGWEYWRFSVNEHHPTQRLAALALPPDRLDALGLELQPWRTRGAHIVIAGSSAKYHDFYELREPTTYARHLVKAIKLLTPRGIIYRPKPSWDAAVPVRGALYSGKDQTMASTLRSAWALVTHGSNACFEAMLAGIPSLVLGNAVTLPLSSVGLADIEAPRLATEAERRRWLANIAYFQWTLAEMASGEAWDFIGRELHA